MRKTGLKLCTERRSLRTAKGLGGRKGLNLGTVQLLLLTAAGNLALPTVFVTTRNLAARCLGTHTTECHGHTELGPFPGVT